MHQLAVDLQKPAAQMHGVRVIAEFHYTGPTGPARTFFAARVFEKLRWVRVGLRQSPCGSGRARVVEFSLYGTERVE